MIKTLILVYVAAMTFSLIGGYFIVKLLKKFKARQTILCYVTEHYKKSGTPTMGGLFFVPVGIICFFIFSSSEKVLSTAAAVICLSYCIVGFLDDFIKVKFSKNEGLTPCQKLIFQFAVALIGGFFAYSMGLTKIFVPFTYEIIDLGFWYIPLAVVVFIATTNCVNLTDGLDGLAGSVCQIFFLFTAALILLEIKAMSKNFVAVAEFENLAMLATAFSGAVGGFLFFNTYKASVFMGDTGSLALGGLVASLMIFSGNLFYVPITGIMFVVSGISVIIQVAHFKRTRRRVFLMAPFHHHLEHKGISESKIVFIYSAITFLFGLASIIRYIGG